MGLPVQFKGANFVLGPPGGWEDAVVPLPVQRKETGQLVSCWQLSEAELAEVARTRKVWISVWGGMTHPPVLVTGCRDEVVAPEP